MHPLSLLAGLLLAQAPAQVPPSPAADAPVVTSAPAATPAPQLPVLTLEEALRQADRQSPDLEVARARLAQADTLSAQAWSAYLPQVTAQGGYTRNSAEANLTLPTSYIVRDVGAPTGPANDPSRPVGPDNPPGGATNFVAVGADYQSVPIQKKDQLGGSISLRQGLIIPEGYVAIRNAYLGEKQATLSVEDARRAILFGVTRAYLGAASLREVLAVQEQLLEVRRGFERNAQARFSVGDVPKLAVLRATLDRARAEQELVRSRNAYTNAKSALATLLARPVDFDVQTPEGQGAVGQSAEKDAASAEAHALEARLDVAASRVGVDVAQGQRRAVAARYLPNLAATGTYNLSNAGGFTGQNSNWSVGLGLSWTLFDGGLREAQLREASGRIAEARATLRASEEKARDEVRRALNDLETTEKNLATAQEQVAVARESALQVKRSFELGAATYLEVSDTNSALAQAELAAVAESLNVRLARLDLERAVGDFDPAPADSAPETVR
ncbi:TolC family protein [Hyalangium rubrum]|uniref:TolC family protein n=1 Tax=Hyalangium rubrum TaxID=3103134 RepID=A0ABU5HIR3_9BACT|nr:TolC family protein [Hyalangium sp. s54d21]MDY7233047.1 TolC family protein [Hyalangium sp. s54d21]